MSKVVFPRAHSAFCRLHQRRSANDRQSGFGKDFLAFFDIRSGQPHNDRKIEIKFLQRLHDPFSHPVAAVDTSEDVDQNGLNIVIRQNQPERLGHPFRRRASPDVEEICRLAACQLDRVHGGHRQTGPR